MRGLGDIDGSLAVLMVEHHLGLILGFPVWKCAQDLRGWVNPCLQPVEVARRSYAFNPVVHVLAIVAIDLLQRSRMVHPDMHG
jgi:hypothetical protein